MPITRCPWHDEADLPRILDLVRQMPLACPHVIDLPWRLGALHRDAGRAAAFWEDSDGQVIGFAACQFPWVALDFFLLPGEEAQSVATDLFAWARAQFQERKGRYPYWVEYRDDDHTRHQLVMAQGFGEEEVRYAWFEHSLAELPLVPSLPDGFTLRPLAGEAEAVAINARRTELQQPELAVSEIFPVG